MIDTIHNTGLRLVTGAFRSSPIPSVLNTAGVAPLDIRRVHSSILLATRSNQNNFKVMNQINDTLKDIPFSHLDVIKNEIIQTPPWLLNIPINSELSKYSKNDSAPIIYKQHLCSITSRFHDYTEIYTDGSKMENGVGAAVVVQDHVSMLRLPNFCSIYTAEAMAISYALDLIKTKCIRKALILSDSLSTLRSIKNISNPNEIARKIQNQIYKLTQTGYSITLIWIPSHNKIPGNEKADEKARQAITSTNAFRLNYFTLHDAKSISRTILNNIWQRAWNQGTSKLNQIKNTIQSWPSPLDFSRKMETAINRIRIGHTSITHQYLMKKEDPPLCISC
ncbi:putative RNA-directed DNA polymerase, partial [Aphis craccivora]